MPEYRVEDTGCAFAAITASEDGEDKRRMCTYPGCCEWHVAEWCDLCRDRVIEQ